MAKPAPPASRIDFPIAVRGASGGFSVLVIGSLLALLISTKLPALGPVLTLAAAVGGFHVAARRVGTAAIPALHGAFAAVLSYLLVLPIWWNFSFSKSRLDVGLALIGLALALATGSLTSWMRSRKRA